mgnify:CR=1 FL=1
MWSCGAWKIWSSVCVNRARPWYQMFHHVAPFAMGIWGTGNDSANSARQSETQYASRARVIGEDAAYTIICVSRPALWVVGWDLFDGSYFSDKGSS